LKKKKKPYVQKCPKNSEEGDGGKIKE